MSIRTMSAGSFLLNPALNLAEPSSFRVEQDDSAPEIDPVWSIVGSENTEGEKDEESNAASPMLEPNTRREMDALDMAILMFDGHIEYRHEDLVVAHESNWQWTEGPRSYGRTSEQGMRHAERSSRLPRSANVFSVRRLLSKFKN